MEMGYAAGWLWLDQVPYKPVFPRLAVSDRHASRSCVFGTGLGVSPGGFFENGIIQNQVGYNFLEARVLLF
jgi:hypothetical protein